MALTSAISLPNTLHAAVLRSPHAHARVRSISLAGARALPGVSAIFTHADLGAAGQPVAEQLPHPSLIGRMFTILALDEVRYVGEPVALVVAESRYVAEDALDVIDVEYEPLPVTADPRMSAESEAALVHADVPGNLASTFRLGTGDVDDAFAQAHTNIKERFRTHRGSAQAMETRGVLARFDRQSGELTVWSATQVPHVVRRVLTQLLGIDESLVRVIAPRDVGGGFGPKAMFYPEEGLLAFAALALDRPVRWSEDRREHLQCAIHERDQFHDVEMALNGDGRALGLRDSVVFDTGAYVPWGLVTSLVTATGLPGPYKVPAYDCRMQVKYTHKVAVAPIRGAGRPEAVFVMERLMDRAAHSLGLDRAEIRFRNLIQPEEMPYATGLVDRGHALTYDSGDYPALLRRALELIGYETFPAEQERARRHGRLLGLGFGCYVEATGLGPFEGATLEVTDQGKVLVTTGAGASGPGPLDHAGPDRRGCAGCASAGRARGDGRHEHHTPWGGHLCQPNRRECWELCPDGSA